MKHTALKCRKAALYVAEGQRSNTYLMNGTESAELEGSDTPKNCVQDFEILLISSRFQDFSKISQRFQDFSKII